METKTIEPKNASQKPITYEKGGLHSSTGTPQSEKIPTKKFARALAGGYGSKAKRQALMAKNVFHVNK